jgi:hypothetical protein
MEKGLVNFDVITNETLGILLVSEVLTKQNQKFSNS